MLRVSEKNFSDILNKFCIYKSLPPTFFGELPYYQFQAIIEEWLDELKKKKEHEEKQNMQYAQEKKQQQMTMPKTTMPKINTPKLK